MALDELKDTDNAFDIDGLKFIIDKNLMKEAAPIKVDFSGFGFKFDCGMDFDDACSACATSSACG